MLVAITRRSRMQFQRRASPRRGHQQYSRSSGTLGQHNASNADASWVYRSILRRPKAQRWKLVEVLPRRLARRGLFHLLALQLVQTVQQLLASSCQGCQHLFCILCFQNCVHPGWPNVSPELARSCSVCQAALHATDAVELKSDCILSSSPAQDGGSGKKKHSARKEKRQKGISPENFHPSTKVNALLGDLMNSSRSNPYSSNYDPSAIEIQMVDEKGNNLDDGIVKTVVL